MRGINLAGEAEAERLSHGYDESKPLSTLDIEDMRSAAKFRGGECLSQSMTTGDMRTPLEWRCGCGHTFKATPTLVLLGGHWCDKCMPAPWKYDEVAEKSQFLVQVWHRMRPNKAGENRIYGEEKPSDFR